MIGSTQDVRRALFEKYAAQAACVLGRARAFEAGYNLFFKGASLGVMQSAFPALSAAIDSYNVVKAQNEAQSYPGLMTTQPMMREMSMGGAPVPTGGHHRHRRHHAL